MKLNSFNLCLQLSQFQKSGKLLIHGASHKSVSSRQLYQNPDPISFQSSLIPTLYETLKFFLFIDFYFMSMSALPT